MIVGCFKRKLLFVFVFLLLLWAGQGIQYIIIPVGPASRPTKKENPSVQATWSLVNLIASLMMREICRRFHLL